MLWSPPNSPPQFYPGPLKHSVLCAGTEVTPPGLTLGFQHEIVCAFGRQLQVKGTDVCGEGVAVPPGAWAGNPQRGLELW